jgi:hypothetical protein
MKELWNLNNNPIGTENLDSKSGKDPKSYSFEFGSEASEKTSSLYFWNLSANYLLIIG